MTPQEFFKKDLFAENAGIVLLEVREGYSKAKLEIKPKHLNAGARTQGGAIFTLADLAQMCIRDRCGRYPGLLCVERCLCDGHLRFTRCK